MDRETLIGILRTAIAVEKKAEIIYGMLSEGTQSKKLRGFWRKMASQETTHLDYWSSLLPVVESGAVSPSLEIAEDLGPDMDRILEKAVALEKKLLRGPVSDSDAFLIAYRLEFYLLHPSLSALFQYVRSPSAEQQDLSDIYEDHLGGFIEALNAYATTSPAMELLGETIHSLWKENRKLTRQSHSDPLTEALNRRGLMRVMMPLASLAKRNRQHVAVLMIDIDDFKRVNDRHGHQAGDELLRKVAGAIRAQLRKSDVVSRYGGEEFLVFLPGVKPYAAADVAEGIRRQVAEATADGIRTSVSVGVAVGKVEGPVEDTMHALIRTADQRLLDAKRSGKDRVVAQ